MPVVTITGASGTGKTTVIRTLISQFPDRFAEAVSTTTRPMRSGEKMGVDYYYVTPEAFVDLDKSDGFLESVVFDGTMYGIQRSELKRLEGRTILLSVEPQGAEQVRNRYSGPLIQVFLDSAPEEVIRQRMIAQGRKGPEIDRRLDHDRKYFSFVKYNGWDLVVPDGPIDSICRAILSLLQERFTDVTPSNSGPLPPPLSSRNC